MKRPHGLRLLSCILLTLSFSYALWTFSVRRNHGMDIIEELSLEEIEQQLSAAKQTLQKANMFMVEDDDRDVIVDEFEKEMRKMKTSKLTGETRDPAAKGVYILIQSRFRTGSTLTERYFTRNSDFFGVHEPGGMLQRDIGLNIMQESREKLAMITDKLLDFMNDIYHCRFSEHEYFLYGLNHMPYYLFRAYLTELEKPVTDDVITAVCNSRPNRIIKACRLFSVLDAEKLIVENDIKVIFLVRDPRAMAISRMHFTHNFTPLQNFDTENDNEFQLDKKMEMVVPDYCEWLVENYFKESDIPEWLKDRYLLVRYEDMQADPLGVVRKMYDFVGVNITDEIIDHVTELDMGNNAERWRDNLRIEEVLRIQKLCGEGIFDLFGYGVVDNQEQLNDKSTSLVLKMPSNSNSNNSIP